MSWETEYPTPWSVQVFEQDTRDNPSDGRVLDANGRTVLYGHPHFIQKHADITNELVKLRARLKLAESVCEAVGRHKANDGQSLGEIFAAHDAYLAGKENDDGEEEDKKDTA
jgi:hypothetical protein